MLQPPQVADPSDRRAVEAANEKAQADRRQVSLHFPPRACLCWLPAPAQHPGTRHLARLCACADVRSLPALPASLQAELWAEQREVVLAPLLVRLAERCLRLAVQKEQPAGYLQLLRGLFKFCYQVGPAAGAVVVVDEKWC